MYKSNCLNCNKEIEYHASQQAGKFCSNACQSEFRFINETIPKFLKGKICTTLTISRCLTHKKGYKCETCDNIGEHNGKPLTLQVDHIDGNSDNNYPDNLRFQCPNCHSQTDTWCSRNRKNSKRSLYMRNYRVSRN